MKIGNTQRAFWLQILLHKLNGVIDKIERSEDGSGFFGINGFSFATAKNSDFNKGIIPSTIGLDVKRVESREIWTGFVQPSKRSLSTGKQWGSSKPFRKTRGQTKIVFHFDAQLREKITRQNLRAGKRKSPDDKDADPPRMGGVAAGSATVTEWINELMKARRGENENRNKESAAGRKEDCPEPTEYVKAWAYLMELYDKAKVQEIKFSRYTTPPPSLVRKVSLITCDSAFLPPRTAEEEMLSHM